MKQTPEISISAEAYALIAPTLVCSISSSWISTGTVSASSSSKTQCRCGLHDRLRQARLGCRAPFAGALARGRSDDDPMRQVQCARRDQANCDRVLHAPATAICRHMSRTCRKAQGEEAG